MKGVGSTSLCENCVILEQTYDDDSCFGVSAMSNAQLNAAITGLLSEIDQSKLPPEITAHSYEMERYMFELFEMKQFRDAATNYEDYMMYDADFKYGLYRLRQMKEEYHAMLFVVPKVETPKQHVVLYPLPAQIKSAADASFSKLQQFFEEYRNDLYWIPVDTGYLKSQTRLIGNSIKAFAVVHNTNYAQYVTKPVESARHFQNFIANTFQLEVNARAIF